MEPTTQNQPPTPQRSYQIPGCSVSIHSEVEGVTVEQLLAIAFNLASANPGAIVDFGITVRGSDDG